MATASVASMLKGPTVYNYALILYKAKGMFIQNVPVTDEGEQLVRLEPWTQ